MKELNIMATQRFNPIFTVSAKLGSVSNRTAQNGTKYAVVSGCEITLPGGETETRTLMAFGKARENVAGLLRKGKTVSLRVQRDGGSLKALGLARAA